jgi:formate dehydrogenase subunit delta
MANQIAKFFAVQGEERAVAGTADHIKKFWEPRMKAAIFAHIDAGGAGLEPLALKALQKLQAAAAATATAPAVKDGKPARDKAAAE